MNKVKEEIAKAAADILLEGKQKLTVQVIVDKCGIARQTFYYHFRNVPQLLEWMLEKCADNLVKETAAIDDVENKIRNFLVIATTIVPEIKKIMAMNYRDEMERIISNGMVNLFTRIAKEAGRLNGMTTDEQQFIIRYHSRAMLGLLMEWSDEDTKHLDEIAHRIALLIT